MKVEVAGDTKVFPIFLAMVLCCASHGSFGSLLGSQATTYNRSSVYSEDGTVECGVPPDVSVLSYSAKFVREKSFISLHRYLYTFYLITKRIYATWIIFLVSGTYDSKVIKLEVFNYSQSSPPFKHPYQYQNKYEPPLTFFMPRIYYPISCT